MKIWFCEDVDSPEQSGFGHTKRAAESRVSGNRGYDGYDGSGIRECVADGWAKRAVRIDVPPAVAAVLVKECRV